MFHSLVSFLFFFSVTGTLFVNKVLCRGLGPFSSVKKNCIDELAQRGSLDVYIRENRV